MQEVRCDGLEDIAIPSEATFLAAAEVDHDLLAPGRRVRHVGLYGGAGKGLLAAAPDLEGRPHPQCRLHDAAVSGEVAQPLAVQAGHVVVELAAVPGDVDAFKDILLEHGDVPGIGWQAQVDQAVAVARQYVVLSM